MPALMAPNVPGSDLGMLCRALNAPDLAGAVAHLAARARAERWSYEDFLVACLERAVSGRASESEEHDDNPLAPETGGVRLAADDDNPLAPARGIEVPLAGRGAGRRPAPVGGP